MSEALTVVELFAGVGGFRVGLERELRGFDPVTGWDWQHDEDGPWQVVFGNQWEPSTNLQHAFDIYADRFDAGHHSNVDIAEVLNDAGVPAYDGGAKGDLIRTGEGDLPASFDLLVGGFPCQDYSVAKPLSQAAGMGGSKGVLWWEIARILQHYRPDHVLLENVDRLLSSPASQRGRDFAIILACFAQLGYGVEWRVVNAAEHGFPQRRRRVFIYATRDPRWNVRLRLPDEADAQDVAVVTRAVSTEVRSALTETGVLARSLPCSLPDNASLGGPRDLRLGGDSVDPYVISERWPKPKRSEWRNAGLMYGGLVWTTDVDPDEVTDLDGPDLAETLGDILLPLEQVLESRPEVVIDRDRLGEDGVKEGSNTWRYLKGAKREPRTKRIDGLTVEYEYTEGAVAFPEPLEKASRTILTGEGGRSPSRFKHVVRQGVDASLLDDDRLPRQVRAGLVEEDGSSWVYRRLTPVELERLNMFPDDWTAKRGVTDGRRAFCMGNALVVGVVDAIGREIAVLARDPDRDPAHT